MYIDGKGYTPTREDWKPGEIKRRIFIFETHDSSRIGYGGAYKTPTYILDEARYMSSLIDVHLCTESVLYNSPSYNMKLVKRLEEKRKNRSEAIKTLDKMPAARSGMPYEDVVEDVGRIIKRSEEKIPLQK